MAIGSAILEPEAHLWQIDPAPQVEAPESGTKPGEFHTAVWDLVERTETPPGQTSWSGALVRHGAEAGEALAGVRGVPGQDIRVRDSAE